MSERITYSKEHPEFVTVTCLEWNTLLEVDSHKDVITSSLCIFSQTKADIGLCIPFAAESPGEKE